MTTAEKIKTWNELPSHEKVAMGDHYITHESNLKAWDKPYEELSPLKQKRVIQNIEDFSKVKFHGIIGSGIDTGTLEENIFKNGRRHIDASELINWGELSRMLSGSRQTVRKNKIPKIHQPFIDDLIKAMNKVIKKRTDNEAGL